MAGQGDEGARAARMGTRGRNIDHHRHGGLEHGLHDIFGDVHAAAGGVQLQDHGLGVQLLGQGDAVLDIFVQHRRHRAVKGEDDDDLAVIRPRHGLGDVRMAGAKRGQIRPRKSMDR